LTACAAVFGGWGHDLVAAELATAAEAVLRRSGSSAAAAQAAEQARRLRSRCPRAVTPLLGLAAGHLALTVREREVAALAAAGRSSPAIARSLRISTRTVDNHLGRVYTKLGLRGRADLATVFPGSEQP
jgi:DNA-binding CsgD family transcriptional regulator